MEGFPNPLSYRGLTATNMATLGQGTYVPCFFILPLSTVNSKLNHIDFFSCNTLSTVHSAGRRSRSAISHFCSIGYTLLEASIKAPCIQLGAVELFHSYTFIASCKESLQSEASKSHKWDMADRERLPIE